ncbi:MAG: aspartate/glutamate racemase family protein [Rhizobiales bacterium]|nr:aspartate/glutamate racemase family protein [Hyphomicrobiales bacterium]
MKTIGIIGGMSAESTTHYYARINAQVRERLGGLHAAEVIIWSLDFAEIAAMQEKGLWKEAGVRLVDVAVRLERAGADVILLATNTMHKVADQITAAIKVPFIHIADATAEKIKAGGLKRSGLMATAYTMEQDFYVGRLRARHGLDVIVPDAADRAETHRIIYDELCKGIVAESSRTAYEAIAARLVGEGADCLILGCTEVGMLLNQTNVSVPVFDTTLIHADRAVDFALGGEARMAAE